MTIRNWGCFVGLLRQTLLAMTAIPLVPKKELPEVNRELFYLQEIYC